MTPNPGHLPEDAIGKRVFVVLENGQDNRAGDPAFASGWAADGRGGCSWARTGQPFDIAAYEVIR